MFLRLLLFLVQKRKLQIYKKKTKPGYPQLLGDKLLFYDTLDFNGLTSPDTVLIIKKSTDSLSLIDLNNKYCNEYKTGILDLSNYYTYEKNQNFAFFIDLNAENDSIIEQFKQAEKTILIKIRKENFDLIDTVTTGNVFSLYSNYIVRYIDTVYRVINPVKLYNSTRVFSRLLKFNELGEQINSITFYDYKIKEVLRYNNKLLIGLNSEAVGNAYSGTNNTCRFVLSDEDFNILWIKEQKKKGLHSEILNGFIQDNNFAFNIEVVESCGACDDDWWKYLLKINEKGAISYSFVSLPTRTKNTDVIDRLYSFDLIDVSCDKGNVSFCFKSNIK